MNFRKLIRVLHRDFGYFFFGASIIYAVSGIALNHKRDFNPSYSINRYDINLSSAITQDQIDEAWVKDLLNDLDQEKQYKKHYFPSPEGLKVFLHHGNLDLNLKTQQGVLEIIRKRPLLYEMNLLHYNPGTWWKWFSDIFCVAWIIISITGLFLIKSGKNSLIGRGGIYALAGIIIPLALLLPYL